MQKLLRASLLLLLALLATLTGLPKQSVFAQEIASPVREIASPAPAASAEPNLCRDRAGRVYLSWVETLSDKRHALRFAVYEKGRWSSARTIAEGENWFVNWADFPALLALDNGMLVASWLIKSGADTYAYNVQLTRSTDKGKTWSQPVTPHRDGTQTEHGFVSFLDFGNRGAAAVWLDGRKFKGEEHGHSGHGASKNEMTLRHTMMSRDGRVADEVLLDERVCECCQTSAAMASTGAVVVYRDRSEKEVRDIAIVRQVNGRWTAPQTVHPDGWEINGCPVNGPSVAAHNQQVAVAWFTGVNNTPRVKMAFSTDAGASFANPVQVDDGDPVGRVEVLLLDDGSAYVVWLERVTGGAEIRARRIRMDGRRDASVTVTQSSAARASGFPQVTRVGKEVFFAWTQTGTPSRVRVAKLVIGNR